jgi:hypothetical protein
VIKTSTMRRNCASADVLAIKIRSEGKEGPG